MNPSVIDPDVGPVHDARDVLPSPGFSAAPDLSKPDVLVQQLDEGAQGMLAESEAASPSGNQCGSSNPSFFYANVAKMMKAAAKMIKAQNTKAPPVAPPAPSAEVQPPVAPPAPSAEASKVETPKKKG